MSHRAVEQRRRKEGARPATRSALCLGAVVMSAACSGATPPPRQSAKPSPALPAPAPLPPPPPARWVDSLGATTIGPTIGDGTLLLLGGRRAFLGKDGSLRAPKGAETESFEEIVVVPGSHGPKLIARDMSTIYRIDDPLGPAIPLVEVDGSITRLGTGPGTIVVWASRSDLPRMLDVETGQPKEMAKLPTPVLRAMEFSSLDEGAAVFEGIGLALTTDGGASFHVASDNGQGDALRVSGLSKRGNDVYAFLYRDGPSAAIDLRARKLGAFASTPADVDEAPLLRWIRTTGRDPLEAAASSGLDAPSGGALVASHGLLARIDPTSGAIIELYEFAKGKLLSPCGAGRTGKLAFIACSLSEDQVDSDLFDPFGVLRVDLGGPKLAVERTSMVQNGEAELRVSASGGAMLMRPCSSENEGGACVRQPDGRWISIPTSVDLREHGAGALDDGRIALLRGLSEVDVLEEQEDERERARDDESEPRARLAVSMLDASGKEKSLPPLDVVQTSTTVRVHSPIEQEGDRSLHFVIDAGSGPVAVIQPLGHGAVTLHPVPGASVARVHAGRGGAVGKGRVLTSLDGGASWNDVPAPPRILDAASMIDDPEDSAIPLAVSEIGMTVGSFLRIGWGPSDPLPQPALLPRARVTLSIPRVAAPAPGAPLSCSSLGPSPSTPPLLGASQLKELLTQKASADGHRRETSSWASGRRSMLGPIALLEEKGSSDKESPPSSWTIRWHDPTEIGGKPYAWTSAPPKGASWGASLRFAAASGKRGFFVLRGARQYFLVRARAGGRSEMIAIQSDLLPTGEVAFGEGRGEPIAWTHDTTLFVWMAGEKPRAIAKLPRRSLHALGAPREDGVPVLLSGLDWSQMRTIPIPVQDKKGDPPPPAAPSLEGWTRLPAVSSMLRTSAPCAPKAKGARFTLQSSSFAAEIDGIEEKAQVALYDVLVDGEAACVASVSALVMPTKGASQKSPAATPAAFVRADFVSKRAEGGERGVPPAAVARMKCSLEEKR